MALWKGAKRKPSFLPALHAFTTLALWKRAQRKPSFLLALHAFTTMALWKRAQRKPSFLLAQFFLHTSSWLWNLGLEVRRLVHLSGCFFFPSKTSLELSRQWPFLVMYLNNGLPSAHTHCPRSFKQPWKRWKGFDLLFNVEIHTFYHVLEPWVCS